MGSPPMLPYLRRLLVSKEAVEEAEHDSRAGGFCWRRNCETMACQQH